MESQSLPGDSAVHLRPQRERRLPQHFDDFQVGYQPAVTEASALATQPTATAEEEATTPELTVVKPPSRPRSVRTESRRSSVASHQTRAKSQASVRSLSQRSTTEGLSELQSAMLEEKVKRMELAEAQRQVMEQTIVDEQCTLLDQQARDALNEREELLREQERQRRRLEEKADLAYKAKEAITRQQLLQQRLKEKEMEVERAALITSFLKEEESKSPPYSRPLSECSKYAAQLHSQREPGLSHSTPFTQAPVFNAAVNPPVSTSLPPAAAPQNRVPATSMLTQLQPTYSTIPPVAIPVSSPAQQPYPAQSASMHYTPPPSQVQYPAPISVPPMGYSQAHVQPAYPPPAQTVPQALSRLPYSYPAMPPVPPQVTAPPPGFRATPSTDLMELLVATSYGLPKPALPHFTSGKESDFALLKMALDNLLNSHAHLTEQFKYQVLLDHLKLPSAYKLAQAYMHDPRPYTSALQALQDKYGQPRQLVQSELGAILNLPQIKAGDPEAFDNFALSVQALLKSQAKRISSRAALMFQDSPKPVKPQKKPQGHSSTVYYNTESQARVTHPDPVSSSKPTPKAKPSFKPYCPYCDTREHYLSLCPKFKTLSTAEIAAWIKDRGCWRCGRNHSPEACTLKKPCNTCKQLHLTVLHEVSQPEPKRVLMVSAAPDTVYVDRPSRPQRVMLKLVRVRLYNAEHSLDGFAILDDGSERTLILPSAVQHLHLTKEPEILPLRSVRHEVIHLQGATVSFEISPSSFTQVEKLPLPSVDKVQPVLLIGSDFPHLLLPKQPVRAGPPGSPIAVCTALGWALQGPATLSHRADDLPHCYFTMSLLQSCSDMSNAFDSSTESWYLPHHVVHHNGKARIVYNCSYQHNGQSLNNQLLPGPTLGPSLLGVLLRFREHCVAISGDIKAMFHQVRLLPEDKPLLRFLWRSMKRSRRHPTSGGDGILCRQLFDQPHQRSKAKTIIDRMRQLLLTGGFDIRQWASNIPSVVEHLPAEAKAASTELWLSQYRQDPEEPALGLRWNCLTDRLGYRHRPVEYSQPTLRNVYKVLATQYDPLGYLIPFTTRAKILVQDLWKVGVGWDDPIQPEALLDLWNQWESELAYLPQVEIPRCYVPLKQTQTCPDEKHTSSVMPLKEPTVLSSTFAPKTAKMKSTLHL
ncbi:hypothetical protein WMY93_000991 [Mugilogobius chulae]|uniref:Peptidase aspartic putative domain-containing protein n=1 Tax=Mugilogobius chulae TaxID=88201 RepID=A0AAW0Q1Y8_9GOBI